MGHRKWVSLGDKTPYARLDKTKLTFEKLHVSNETFEVLSQPTLPLKRPVLELADTYILLHNPDKLQEEFYLEIDSPG